MNSIMSPVDHRNGPWRFLHEGALFHTDRRIAVVSDLHLGYEQSRAIRGDFLPLDSDRSIRQNLGELFRRSGCTTLVVAGDILESSAAIRQNPAYLLQFSEWIRTQGVEPVFLRGNHDSQDLPACESSYLIDGWCISHGHEAAEVSLDGQRRITGHLHPSLRWGGRAWRVFLNSPDRILLPAFSVDAAGVDILDFRFFPDEFWGESECLVCRSGDVISFGSLRLLRGSVATSVTRVPARMARPHRKSFDRRTR